MSAIAQHQASTNGAGAALGLLALAPEGSTTAADARLEGDRVVPTRERQPTAWLVDAVTPEFAALLEREVTLFDALLLPLRLGRARYAWPRDRCVETHASLIALSRAIRLRLTRGKGQARRSLILAYDRRLAAHYAKDLSPLHTHVVVAQSVLPHLWRMGALAGRSFDVLMSRLPLAELERRLDDVSALHPESPTQDDVRAPADLVATEAEALRFAGRLVTPHRAIAALHPTRTVLLDWAMPAVAPVARGGRTLLFPASAHGRKGAYELRQALDGLDVELLVTGRGHDDFWGDLPVRRLAGPLPRELAGAVLPAIVEHQPRALLRALSAGLPVVATPACGFGDRPGVMTVPAFDAAALRQAIVKVLDRS